MRRAAKASPPATGDCIREDQRQGLASAHYNRGLSWFEAGQYDRAIADYDASIRLDPASASSFNNRGSAWYAKGGTDRALADFEKAIELNPAGLDEGEPEVRPPEMAP